MRVKKNKYAGLKSSGATPILGETVPLRLTFKERSGRQQYINLNFLSQALYPRPQMARVFAWYFQQAMQHVAPATRLTMLSGLRKFINFLDWKAEGGEMISSTEQITTTLLLEYQLWLDVVTLLHKRTACFNYRIVATVVAYLLVNKPEVLPQDLKIPRNKFLSSRREPSTAKTVSVETLTKIHDAAVKEVTVIRNNHTTAKRMLTEGEEYTPGKCIRGYWKSLANVLVYLVRQIGINSYPSINQRSLLFKNNHTPLEVINLYAPTSDRNFIPFLVLLFSKTLINVETLFRMKRNCLKEHPLPVGLTIIEFDKPRAGTSRSKSLSFPPRQENGAVDLITFLLEYTAPWIPFARKSEKGDLFLYRVSGPTGTEIRSPGANFATHGLKNFIQRNNLPEFSFSQLRPTVATLIYLQTKDIFRVQRLLCHMNVRMTIDYIKQEVTRWQHELQIHKGIASVIEQIIGDPVLQHQPTVFTEPLHLVLEEKVERGEIDLKQAELISSGGCSTGIARCKNPFDSPIPGESKGRLCKQLHMCIFCPNAWIFEEDLPKVSTTGIRFYRNRRSLLNKHGTSCTGKPFVGLMKRFYLHSPHPLSSKPP